MSSACDGQFTAGARIKHAEQFKQQGGGMVVLGDATTFRDSLRGTVVLFFQRYHFHDHVVFWW